MPTLEFTDRGLRGLKPLASRVDYWDDSVPGPGMFGIRVTPSGVKTWCVFYKIGGRSRRRTIGRFPAMSLADARATAKDDLAKAQLGQDPAAEKQVTRRRERETVRALFEDYSTRAELRQEAGEFKSWVDVKRSLERDVVAKWGDRPVRDIRRKDVAALVADKALVGAASASQLQAHVSMLLAFGVENDWLDANPVAGLRKRKVQPRDRVLTGDELRALWLYLGGEKLMALTKGAPDSTPSAIPGETAQALRDLFKVLVLTGQRLKETSRMAWADVDLDARVWLLPSTETKNRTAHRVPLSLTAMKILERRYKAKALGATFVFPTVTGASVLVWSKRTAKEIAKAVGFKFRAHDLRRTLATGLGELGISMDVIGLVLNHSKVGVTGRHYDLSTREAAKRDALEKWAARVEAVVAGKTAKVVPMRRGRKGGAA